MAFTSRLQLSECFAALGVTRAFFKPLSENDNIKQQIYLGGSFQTLNQIPFGSIRTENLEGEPNYKASVDLWWMSDTGEVAPARHSKLILYPRYPEIRLSGFVRGCPVAPSAHLQPVPIEQRTGRDGRILVLGVTPAKRVYAYLAPAESNVARSIVAEGLLEQERAGVFFSFPIRTEGDGKQILITRLDDIFRAGWHRSCRLDKHGDVIDYKAPNAGGYTLEALLGIIPNGISKPDFMEWEIKTFSSERITLMTPEPDSGFYGDNGVAAFVRRYGHDRGDDTLYFTGIHKISSRNSETGMTMRLDGFDIENGRILNPSGGIVLLSRSGEDAAIWSFPRLMEHWGRKHARALYVTYEKRMIHDFPHFKYSCLVFFGIDTDFSLFLRAMAGDLVYLDPASKVSAATSPHPIVKARNQFRVSFRNVNVLYRSFEELRI